MHSFNKALFGLLEEQKNEVEFDNVAKSKMKEMDKEQLKGIYQHLGIDERFKHNKIEH